MNTPEHYWEPKCGALTSDPRTGVDNTEKLNQFEALSAAYSSLYDGVDPSHNPLDTRLLTYQRAGVLYGVERLRLALKQSERGRYTICKGVLIADDMGLGKTAQACQIIQQVVLNGSVVIVCPASMVGTWRREFEKWHILHTDAMVFSYEAARKKHEMMLSLKIGFLVVDECHYIKNPKTWRTNTITRLAERAQFVIALSGTPMTKAPEDIQTILQILNVPWAQSRIAFVDRYCKRGAYGKICDVDNAEELSRLLRRWCMVRRTKEQVLKQLPAKRRQVIEVERTAEMDPDEREAIDKLARTDIATIENLRDIVNGPNVRASKIAELRKASALRKCKDVAELVKDTIATGNKCVLFAHHLDVIDDLKDRLASVRYVCVTGSTSPIVRDEYMHQFQNDPGTMLFIGSITACGVGITLTAASNVVFAELDWSPSVIYQAEDRCHRIGQKDMVLVRYVVEQDSIDAMIARKIAEKEHMINPVMG